MGAVRFPLAHQVSFFLEGSRVQGRGLPNLAPAVPIPSQPRNWRGDLRLRAPGRRDVLFKSGLAKPLDVVSWLGANDLAPCKYYSWNGLRYGAKLYVARGSYVELVKSIRGTVITTASGGLVRTNRCRLFFKIGGSMLFPFHQIGDRMTKNISLDVIKLGKWFSAYARYVFRAYFRHGVHMPKVNLAPFRHPLSLGVGYRRRRDVHVPVPDYFSRYSADLALALSWHVPSYKALLTVRYLSVIYNSIESVMSGSDRYDLGSGIESIFSLLRCPDFDIRDCLVMDSFSDVEYSFEEFFRRIREHVARLGVDVLVRAGCPFPDVKWRFFATYYIGRGPLAPDINFRIYDDVLPWKSIVCSILRTHTYSHDPIPGCDCFCTIGLRVMFPSGLLDRCRPLRGFDAGMTGITHKAVASFLDSWLRPSVDALPVARYQPKPISRPSDDYYYEVFLPSLHVAEQNTFDGKSALLGEYQQRGLLRSHRLTASGRLSVVRYGGGGGRSSPANSDYSYHAGYGSDCGDFDLPGDGAWY